MIIDEFLLQIQVNVVKELVLEGLVDTGFLSLEDKEVFAKEYHVIVYKPSWFKRLIGEGTNPKFKLVKWSNK